MNDELNYLNLFLPLQQAQDNTIVVTRQYVDKQKASTIYKPISVITQGRTTPKTKGEKYLAENMKKQVELKEEQQKEAEQKVKALEGLTNFLDFTSPAKHYEAYTGKDLNSAEEFAVDVVADPVTYLSLGIFPLVKKLFKKQIKNEVLDNLYKYIGGHHSGKSILNSKIGFTPVEKEQIKLLQKAGVDLSKISREDLSLMLSKRYNDLLKSNAGRVNLVNKTNNGWEVIDVNLGDGNIQQNGRIKLDTDGNNLTLRTMVSYDDKNKKVAERAYNSAIQIAKQNNLDGVISGNNLISAPKTYKVWEHFPNKEIISNTGIHNNHNVVNNPKSFIKVNNEEDMLRATQENIRAINYHGKVVKLKDKSSLPTITKSTSFNPIIINKNGKMQIDWKNSDIFKVMVPFSILPFEQSRRASENDNP